MTDHTPIPVVGYTPQSDDKIALVNELKVVEELYLRLLDRLGPNALGLTPPHDQAMIQIARRKMQEANMWAVRAIFQPTRIKLPEDTP